MKTLILVFALASACLAQITNPSGSGSGTVNNATGAANAYYAGAGTAVSGDTNIVDDGSGNWTFSGTNPTFTTSTTNKGITFTPQGSGTYIFGGGVTMSGASGAATTIGTSTSNANIILAPNGTGAVSVPAGAAATPGLIFAGDTAGNGFYRSGSSAISYTNGTSAKITFAPSSGIITTNGNFYAWSSTADSTGTKDTCIDRAGAKVIRVDGNASCSDGLGYRIDGMKTFVTSDFTTAANTNLQTITGLSWTLPASTAVNYSFHCALLYSQATATAAVAFGVQGATTAPTQINASGIEWSAASGAWTATGVLTGLNTTTATNVVSGTPSAITTVWRAELDGTIEAPSNASPTVFNVMVSTATSGDAVTVKRGSYCALY